eukprot:2307136-Alexandrium_andersonii.AAC.1
MDGAWLVEPGCERCGQAELHQLQRPPTGVAAKAVAAEEIPAGCVALTMWAGNPVAAWPNPQEGAAPWVRCETD